MTATTSKARIHTSFATLLRSELAKRCEKNERYSLRAFARDLDIEHATLSQLLRGQRELTAATVDRLARQLGLDDGLRDDLIADVRTPRGAPEGPKVAHE